MHVVILSGAGMSAESGLKTFRDSNGLWEGYDVMQVASPEGWQHKPELVLDFYNQRRKQLLTVRPNKAHYALAALETMYDVSIITQNVDDLHERAGSRKVLHLHGELLKVRSSVDPDYILEWKKDLSQTDFCVHGQPLRPHIVWFGEQVPAITEAETILAKADVVAIIGTSLQVYPAANLIHSAPATTPVFYIDPNPSHTPAHVNVIAKKATLGVPEFINLIK